MAQDFIHLRVHSDYSLGYGAIKVADLIKHAVQLDMPALALTDYHNLFASMEFSQAAIKQGLQPIIGCVICVQYSYHGQQQLGQLLLIAKNDLGYANLLELTSDSFVQSATTPYITMERLVEKIAGLLILCGTTSSPVGKLLAAGHRQEAEEFILTLQQAAGDHLYLELIRRGNQQEELLEEFLLSAALRFNIPIVATNEICFLSPLQLKAQDAMMCIAHGQSLYAEERPKANPEHYFKSPAQMKQLFADLPEAISNSVQIAKRISVFTKQRSPIMPNCLGEGVDEDQEIERQAIAGLQERLRDLNKDEGPYYQRLEMELSVIKKMRFSGYFLIVSDFIKWAKSHDIPVGPGRGSGAGSIVAWVLQITDIDPLRFGLLFERFLNPERVSMPDFDIDFCQERRDEVIEYVRKKYGADRVASIITFGKLQAKGVLRDVGRVLGMGFNETDKICKMVPDNPVAPVTLAQAIQLDKELQRSRDSNPQIKELLEISLQLEGMNRHTSIHAAGIVIADRPLQQLVPLHRDQHTNTPIVQYTYKYAEMAGLVKFDFLGLKTLTVIAGANKLIRQHTPDFSLSSTDFADAKTYELLTQGKTVGVFQFESAGMRETIKKLKPDSIEDLIALGALYRPGPMNNIASYINRKHGLEKPDYIHPLLKETLQETYGIIVYQEQVMQIACVLAGYSLGGADLLRRAMGKKNKAEMESQRLSFINGAVNNGVSRSQAAEIFELVDKFASYGFPKPHAAAYAVISYHTAYQKANYPLEFLTASINLEINDTDKIQLFCEEARSLAISILPPDINCSGAYCNIEGKAIRYGLAAIKSVGVRAMEQLVAQRKKLGKFANLSDFLRRCSHIINRKMLEKLIQAGALASIHENGKQLLANSDSILKQAAEINRRGQQPSLFAIAEDICLQEADSWTLEEALENEFEAFGFYLSKHPLKMYGEKLLSKLTPSNKLHDLASKKGTRLKVGGAITNRRVRFSTHGKYAFVQLSDLHGIFEVTIFDNELLNKHIDDLDIGSSVYMEIDARCDEKGTRFTAHAIEPLQQFAKRTPQRFAITISDPALIPQLALQQHEGPLVQLAAAVEGYVVSFSSKQPYRMLLQEVQRLKTLPEAEVREI